MSGRCRSRDFRSEGRGASFTPVTVRPYRLRKGWGIVPNVQIVQSQYELNLVVMCIMYSVYYIIVY